MSDAAQRDDRNGGSSETKGAPTRHGFMALASGTRFARGYTIQSVIAAGGFGIHDMHGNVLEWVQDCYKDGYAGAPTDGRSVPDTSGCPRVLRGGSWFNTPQFLRFSYRDRYLPVSRDFLVGFRLARTLNP